MARVEVFSAPDCAYCERAKALLDAEGVAFEERNVSDPAHHEELTQRLPRVRALPQLFVDGAHIGSFEDLEILRRDGRLARVLGR